MRARTCPSSSADCLCEEEEEEEEEEESLFKADAVNEEGPERDCEEEEEEVLLTAANK